MCRFLVYKGSTPLLLSDLILSPTHSILTQSFDSRLRLDTRRPHNGDGFGIGYYTTTTTSSSSSSSSDSSLPDLGPEPCIFTSTIPAWNCLNLERLARKTRSGLVFAHVRATTEGNLSEQNCHPFSWGSLMWMHNGGIGGWRHVKRALGASVGDEWYMSVQGSTDSEWAFAVFLDCLDRMGFSPSEERYQERGFGHTVLRKAVLQTIERVNRLIRECVPRSGEGEESEDTRSLLNFAVTDGHSVVCSRYVSSRTDEAASLYFSSGTSWKEINPPVRKHGVEEKKGNFKMERRDKGADIVLVASEPLTFERDNWVTVPTNSTLTIHNQTVMIHPIIDEFFNNDPAFVRSSGFAEAKGQSSGSTVNKEADLEQSVVASHGAASRNGVINGVDGLRSGIGRLNVLAS